MRGICAPRGNSAVRNPARLQNSTSFAIRVLPVSSSTDFSSLPIGSPAVLLACYSTDEVEDIPFLNYSWNAMRIHSTFAYAKCAFIIEQEDELAFGVLYASSVAALSRENIFGGCAVNASQSVLAPCQAKLQ